MLRTAVSSGGILSGAARVLCSATGAGATPSGSGLACSIGRLFTSSQAPTAAQITASTDAERSIAEKIAGGLPGAKSVRVEDTSGGCGTMYAIEVTAADFDGKTKIKQHQLVTKLLSDDVKQWHGFQLVTKTP